jgi:hypothetical protein
VHYLTGAVSDFRDWLAQRFCGQPIGFTAPGGFAYPDLQCAVAAYSWPPRAKRTLPNPHSSLPHVHPTVPTLPAKSGLAANIVVLNIIRHAMLAAYAAGPAGAHRLSGAVASVLHWGGVYTTPGNRGWLTANHSHLFTILQAVVLDYAGGSDTSAVVGLRFNSGMTKVYSLLINDFIIYDSRVAAAIAWLAKRWWTAALGHSPSTLPSPLRFACLPANGAMAGYRNPCIAVFPNLTANPYEHYKWNVRANWLLSSALAVAGSASLITSLREAEAGLFQIGQRVI